MIATMVLEWLPQTIKLLMLDTGHCSLSATMLHARFCMYKKTYA